MRIGKIILLNVVFFLLLELVYSRDKKPFIYPDDVFRDPFEALVSKNGDINIKLIKQRGRLYLNGIVYDETSSGSSFALINNNLVKAGDFIGRYKVKKIERYKVILEKEGKQVILNSEETKK